MAVDTTSPRRIHCVQFAQLDLSRVFGNAHCQKEGGLAGTPGPQGRQPIWVQCAVQVGETGQGEVPY